MNVTIRKTAAALLVLVLWAFFAQKVFSHCEIPCGIYDDEARFTMLVENVTTVEKSMNQIIELSKESKPNNNQIVRWVMNKEHHDGDIIHILTQYFLTQRIKPVADKSSQEYKDYAKKLTLVHEMIVFSMKAKQTTDLENVAKLRSHIADFKTAYMGGWE